MKTYEECKDEVAKKYGYTEWEQKIHENGVEFVEKIFKEIAQKLVGEAIVLARKEYVFTNEGMDGSREPFYTEQEIKDKLFKQ